MRLPLILLTSMGVRADHPEVEKIAFASCMTKPIKSAQLYEVLVRVISGGNSVANKTPATSKLDPSLSSRLPLRVLLCDDNAINQKVASRLLLQMGYQTTLAANGLEALAALDKTPYDLVFMDVMMPEMGGLEATQEIRLRQQQRKNFPNYKSPIIIVAMTASAMQGDREKCLAAGMDDYLSKPVRPEDIRGILERWGAKAAAEEVVQVIGGVTEPQASPFEDLDVPRTADDEPPVDMERLLDFTDGNAENLRELATLYIEQTSGQVVQLAAAVEASNAVEVRRIAHSCAGASATCGMRRLVPLLRELEKQGHEAKLSGSAQICREVSREFQVVRQFLESYLAVHCEVISKTCP
jgi:CheY-like chemotaxis protein/HPt (histidine-containing phosphotransfer) domain-containing protein